MPSKKYELGKSAKYSFIQVMISSFDMKTTAPLSLEYSESKFRLQLCTDEETRQDCNGKDPEQLCR